MKKTAAIIVAAIGLVALGFAALPLLVSSEAVRATMLERARQITGREMQFTGTPEITFSPFLGIELNNVTFRDAYGEKDAPALLQMPVLRGKLSITAALRGSIEVSEFHFVRPVFNLVVYESGRTSWAFPVGKMWRALSTAKELRAQQAGNEALDINQLDNIRLGSFDVSDGIINYSNEATGAQETVTSLNGTLNWPNIRAGWRFEGSAIWRGDAITGRMTAELPIMLLAGGISKISASLKSEPLNLDFTGEANRLSDLFVSGNVNLSSPSLRRMVTFLGGEVEPGAGFESFAASGTVSGTMSDIQLADSTIGLDGNTYMGNLRFTISETGKNKLSGTLAADRLDLQPYALLLLDGGNRKTLFTVVNQSDADIRVSAKTLSFPSLELKEFAGSLIARENEIKLDVGNAAFGNGILAGSISATGDSEHALLGFSVDGSGLNLVNLPFLKDHSRLLPDGPSTIRARLTSGLSEQGALLETMNGNFTISMASGSIAGLDFSEVLKTLDPKSNDGENVMIAKPLAATPVTQFEINATISDGTAWVQNSRFEVEGYSARLSGKTELSGGSLAMWGGLEVPKGQADNIEGGQFFLGGTLRQPLLVPQLRSPERNRTAIPDSVQKAASSPAAQSQTVIGQ